MAYDNDQEDFPLPAGNSNQPRKSEFHLPKYFRTQANQKFLHSTIDQFLQPGVVEKLNGYLGRKTAKAVTTDDNYIEDVSKNRQDYQLEPALVIKDNLDNVTFYKDYNDYINILDTFGVTAENHSRLNAQEYYAWNPMIDWDKFSNFREYYWLPTGPNSVPIIGDELEIESTFTVTLEDNGDNYAFKFSPDGLTQNPNITLYRGVTYKFEVDSPGIPFTIKTSRNSDPIFTVEGVDPKGTESGTITLKIDENTPDSLFYCATNTLEAGGLFKVQDKTDATFINVQNEIIGKKSYTSSNGITLTNGLKVTFEGAVTPEKYADSEWYVEGVGTAIRLVSQAELNLPSKFANDLEVEFDKQGFDMLPFSKAIGYPSKKDYICINRASQDGNLWSRYNRWFHKDVIELCNQYNNDTIYLDQSARATRPIIEFNAGLKLFESGTVLKKDVDLIDTFTTDVFSTIEGSAGYNIDGVDVAEGMRILFTADTDSLVKDRIFEVDFITVANSKNTFNRRQIALQEVTDSIPEVNQNVLVKQGTQNAGLVYFYNGQQWKKAQEKTSINQQPLFDLFDENGVNLADSTVYPNSTFTGNTVFSYKQGTGTPDSELGFPLSYRSIENIGDIVFNFDLINGAVNYEIDNETFTLNTETAVLEKYDNNIREYQTAWIKAKEESAQPVIRQFFFDNTITKFPIDVYDNSASLTDLWIRVYKNNQLQFLGKDYNVGENVQGLATIEFVSDLELNDNIIIKTKSSADKNEKGHYDFPINLEKNPLNNNINEFTLGEVNDHVSSIVENVEGFEGIYPGTSNLRDIGNLSKYGQRFVQHSSPLNLAIYHLTNKDANVVNSIKFARREYGKFKRLFLQTANDLGFDGATKNHFDKILAEMTRDKTKSMPFYFSDMVGFGANISTQHEILDTDDTFFALSKVHNNNELSRNAVNVYQNGRILTYGKDYTFNSDGFCIVTANKQVGDIIEIVEYENTNGSYIPPTPSKLGLYPSYEPAIFFDTTYQDTPEMVAGPFKIYGVAKANQQGQGQLGYYYPLYLDESNAIQADTDAGGTGQSHQHTFEGTDTVFYMPASIGVHAGQDNELLDLYTEGKTVIQGHDGSIILAYGDFRDNLLLELENRIYNNIKTKYRKELLDIQNFLPRDYDEKTLPRDKVNEGMISDFIQWLNLVDEDFSAHSKFIRGDGFTYNYSSMTSPQGKQLPGFWRQVYKFVLDTDRPHSHPWEMLGFSIKPTWWENEYGPSPYTRDNLRLWEDLQNGIIREPGKPFRVIEKFKRPNLTQHIPVDEKGKLISPSLSGVAKNYIDTNIKDQWKFGDGGPVESAWRKSSEYPFALITSWLLNQPAKVMALGYDNSRLLRNLSGNIVYKETGKRIRLSDLVYPNDYTSTKQVYSSGLVNYITNYIASDITTTFNNYKNDLQNITNQLGAKLGGYTDKDKFKLILDSRNPLNEGNVFIPDENYKIFLNTSSPIASYIYSGIIIEKATDGWIIKGYDSAIPTLKAKPAIVLDNDPYINVGGISESFIEWDDNQNYEEGKIVEFGGKYYRVTQQHTSTSSFDSEKFAQIPELPIKGGQSAYFRKKFTDEVVDISYGTKYKTIQEVVDVILGYGKYLESLGFVFDNYNDNSSTVEDWNFSAREFLFWTTQNWDAGAVIALSPGSNKINFKSEYSVVDNIFDTFFGYSLLKADGKKLVQEFSSLGRQEPNQFVLKTKNTADGIFSVRLPLVQKEHVLLLDNKTVFNDIIYDQEPGYRQERVKVLGYRTDSWDGSLNIPGFVYDDAVITEWESWKDYAIGETVKYKEFYYAAKSKTPGKEFFDANDWSRLAEKPEPGLYSNFDYKTNQFADFYDLDSDNFDTEQQKLAQHLIGYQKRKYLENIINDDVSQYKFYQGFIQDKGTRNALTKLFDVLGSADKESLDFYEEWAIKTGQYGAAEGFEEIEYKLDESKFRLAPQPIELVNSITGAETDLVYRIRPFEAYVKPENYNHQPFPKKYIISDYTKNSGYVNQEDVQFTVGTYDDIIDLNFDNLLVDDYIWVGNVENDWMVYKHIDLDIIPTEVKNITETSFTITVEKTIKNIKPGQLIGLQIETKLPTNDSSLGNTEETAEVRGIFKVKSVDSTELVVEKTENKNIEEIPETIGYISGFRPYRYSSVADANQGFQDVLIPGDKTWIDDVVDGEWRVLQNTGQLEKTNEIENSIQSRGTYSENINYYAGDIVFYNDKSYIAIDNVVQDFGGVQTTILPTNNQYWSTDISTAFGSSISTNSRNTVMAVGSPNNGRGSVTLYERANETTPWKEIQNLTPNIELVNAPSAFGTSVAFSEDGKYLVVGAPRASNLRTKYKNDYTETVDYTKDDIVSYNEILWRAVRDIEGAEDNIIFDSFHSVARSVERLDIDGSTDPELQILLTGNFPFTSQTTNHFLVRAPSDQYAGTTTGDIVSLKWNKLTYANQQQVSYDNEGDPRPLPDTVQIREPFNNNVSYLDGDYITKEHTIHKKVDSILYVDASINIPQVGDVIESAGAVATVNYVYFEGASATIYVGDLNGEFDETGSLFFRTSGDFIGEFERVAPFEDIDSSSEFAGFWMILTDNLYDVASSITQDQAKGLVYVNVKTTDTSIDKLYNNVLDNISGTVQSENTENSIIQSLSYQGFPGAGGITDPILFNKYVVKASKDITDNVSIGDNINLWVNTLPRYADGKVFDPQTIGLSYTETNQEHEIIDIWDGYIKLRFTKFDDNDEPFELEIGDVVRDRSTGAVAEVAYYRRDLNEVLIYVKNINNLIVDRAGNALSNPTYDPVEWFWPPRDGFSVGRLFGDNSEIQRLKRVDDPAVRIIGQIDSIGLEYAPDNIGKFLVFENNTGNIPLTDTDIIRNSEYWLWQNGNVLGIAREPNIPSQENNDWEETYKIPATANGDTSGLTNEGMFAVFIRTSAGFYADLGYYTVPERDNNFFLGNDIKITKQNDLYRTFVHAKGNNTTNNFGKIYFIANGTNEEGTTFNWEFNKNKKYRGIYQDTRTYFEDDIVYYNNKLYKSLTNILPRPFDTDDWEEIVNPDTNEPTYLDFVGYVPNTTSASLPGITQIDVNNLESFGRSFDVSNNGEVVITSLEFDGIPNKVAVYRNTDGLYAWSQYIESPNTDSSFGNTISISEDGMYIAIGEALNDDIQRNQGKVYVYKQTDGQFALFQTLISPENEPGSRFGSNVQFDGTILAITGENSDSKTVTSFDTYLDRLVDENGNVGYVNDPSSYLTDQKTTFDNNFTQFNFSTDNNGVVYVYQFINGGYLFAQALSDTNTNITQFGDYLHLQKNHIFVGLPRLSNEDGSKVGFVQTYRTPKTVWTELRKPDYAVDVKKIKRAILYDTKQNTLLTYLDYIDPIQGKIAGPAEQNISYKTYFDPASYTVGNSDVTVDETNTWGESQVGQLWWNLTAAKFVYPYQDNVIFKTNNWNSLFTSNSIEVYEWVSSEKLPSQYDELSGTEEGLSKGFSGKSLYGDSAYVRKRVYDTVAQRFTNKYYFWVKDKKTVPDIEGRTLNSFDVARLIEDPASQGYKFIALTSPTSFTLYNCDSLVKGTDTALSIQYWIIDNQDINIHNQYQLITEGLSTSKPKPEIEKKWIESLIGYDERNRVVPDFNLPAKEKYGTLFKPRQSWFVNRAEAMKQYIERVNKVLFDNLIVETKNISGLFAFDPEPSVLENLYDTTVDNLDQINFVGISKARTAVLTPVVEAGKIVRVIITDSGRGYRNPPTVEVKGSGTDADIRTEIDSQGKVISVIIKNQGKNFRQDASTFIEVRPFTILVKNDSTIQNKWALYKRNFAAKTWDRVISQGYDVRLMWEYADWYAQGYNELTEFNHIVESSYQLSSLQDELGDVVKIQNVGTGGWLLLRKIDQQENVDYSVNYETIGRQNGTIQFKDTLYKFTANKIGFDAAAFDSKFFDNQPVEETRRIVNIIKDQLFVNDLEIEYNNLFFASLRYVFAEQNYVDWAFKTSFVKAKHNVGDLEQKVTFQNDNLPSYEEYLKEVKPFKTKIREYLSNYDKVDEYSGAITDFDLPATYSKKFGEILPQTVKIEDGLLVGINDSLDEYPFKHWTDNFTYSIEAIEIAEKGSGWLSTPVVTFEGGGGTGAKAVAFMGRGKINKIEIIDSGSGYTSAPTVILNGAKEEGSLPTKLGVQIGGSVVRNINTVMKFDRIDPRYNMTSIDVTETFVGTGSRTSFELTWPMDFTLGTFNVTVNNIELLRSEFTYTNEKNDTKGYIRQHGKITLTEPAASNTTVVITYKKNIELFTAQDRIYHGYDPKTGQPAKDLSQLMDGVDYGGVEVRSYSFGGTSGYNSDGFLLGGWDTYDTLFQDEIFDVDITSQADQDQLAPLVLNNPLEQGISYNVYFDNVRVDDPNYGTQEPVTNPNAVMQTITGNGQTEITIDGSVFDSSVTQVIIRKATSDGTFLPDPGSYDTQLSGGVFDSTLGIDAESIIVDGDEFITPMTSKGPEEIVPGKIFDTVDIQVYERPSTGGSKITVNNYHTDGTKTNFAIQSIGPFKSNILVKIDYEIVANYTVEFDTSEIVFDSAPAAGKIVTIYSLDTAGSEILDIDKFIGDGEVNEFLTNVRYEEDINYFVTINGENQIVSTIESDDSYAVSGNLVIQFPSPPESSAEIKFAIFKGETKSYSEVVVDNFVANGIDQNFALSETPFEGKPISHQIIVKADDNILSAGYNKKFVVSEVREYQLEIWQIPVGSINATDVRVFLNEDELVFVQDWTFEGAGAFDPNSPPDGQPGSTVILNRGVGQDGDILRVYVTKDSEYTITNNILTLTNVPSNGTEISVYQFSNHASLGIERKVYDIVERTPISFGSNEYYRFKLLEGGQIYLDSIASSSADIWVIKNGKLLSPGIDYNITGNKKYIQLAEELDSLDRIEFIHFAAPKIENKFGFRQFKDITNRNIYARIDGSKNYILAKDLNWWDNSIHLDNADGLPSPQGSTGIPGVLFIEGERIEYFVRQGNILKQLRRGTIGTGVKDIYNAGIEVYDQSGTNLLPYRDETAVLEFDTDGTSNTYNLDFNPQGLADLYYNVKGRNINPTEFFEVFVAGRRLRKNEIQLFQFEERDQSGNVLVEQIAQDSPEADITVPAQFSVNNSILTLNETPPAGVKVTIVRKIGKLWAPLGTTLANSDSDISKFLRARTTDLPR